MSNNNAFVIHEPLHHNRVYASEESLGGSLDNFRMGLSHKVNRVIRGLELWAKLSCRQRWAAVWAHSQSQWFSRSYRRNEIPTKTLATEAQWVGEHTDMAGGWHALTPQEEKTEASGLGPSQMPPTPTHKPCVSLLVCFWLASFIIKLYLNDKIFLSSVTFSSESLNLRKVINPPRCAASWSEVRTLWNVPWNLWGPC